MGVLPDEPRRIATAAQMRNGWSPNLANRQRRMSGFRSHLPPEGCPSEEAVLANGDFFRLVNQSPADTSDFLSLAEQNKPCPPTACPCEWSGISLCRSRADIQVVLKLRGRNRNAKIAQGKLSPAMGVTQDTPRPKIPSHVTYWPYATAEPWLVFQIEEPKSDE